VIGVPANVDELRDRRAVGKGRQGARVIVRDLDGSVHIDGGPPRSAGSHQGDQSETVRRPQPAGFTESVF
jgi:hypothetical protein